MNVSSSMGNGSANITDKNYQRRSMVAALLAAFGIAAGAGVNVNALRGLDPRRKKTWGDASGHKSRRQGERIRRQIDKGMLSVGSKGFRAPLTREQAGLSNFAIAAE